ncbi:MAG: aryl-sulfate sulfotransferase [Myxococcota bacterium]
MWFVLAVGCGAGDIEPQQVRASVSETMGTVVEVTWTTTDPTTGFVRFGEGGALTRATTPSTEPTTEHSVLLVGLPPDERVDYAIVTGEGRREVEDRTRSVRTDPLDGFAPEVAVTGDPVEHFLVVPALETDRSGRAHPVIIDPQGRIVWSVTDTREAQVYRAQLSRDGSGLTYSATVVRGGPVTDSAIVRVDWHGDVLVTHDIPFLAHDFVELADGTLVSLASECRDVEGNPVALDDGGCPDAVEGNTLIAIAPDGSFETLWTTWDCLDPELHPSIADDRDNWTHSNALDYDEATDTYVVSLRNLNSLLSVDVETRTCAWGLGGVAGTLDLQGPTFRNQHQFHRIGDRLLVFDNRGGFPDSRVLEYVFDPEAGTAVAVREFVSDPPLYTLVLGDVTRTRDGSTRIFWGNQGVTELYGPDGDLRSRLEIDDMILGFSQIVTDPGRPELEAP